MFSMAFFVCCPVYVSVLQCCLLGIVIMTLIYSGSGRMVKGIELQDEVGHFAW